MITFHNDFEQGSQQWLDARLGLMTASEMKLVITAKTLKVAANEKVTGHVYELAAQRLTKYVEPHYISDDMIRGREDEIRARAAYELQNDVKVQQVGFITNDKFGFTLGYSPDGLVGDVGQIEAKSRVQKKQLQTICDLAVNEDDIIQVQTGLLVSERKWCDYISYSGGMHMVTIRAYADPVLQAAIIAAATVFEGRVREVLARYRSVLDDKTERLLPTERVDEMQMV